MSASRSQREVAETLQRLREEIAAEQGTPGSGANRRHPANANESQPEEKHPKNSVKDLRKRKESEPSEPRGAKLSATETEEEGGGPRVLITPPPPRGEPSVPDASHNEERMESGVSERRTTPSGQGKIALSRHRFQVMDQDRTDAVLEELFLHQRRGRGKVIGIAGLPRHGKTTLADRLRERAAARPGADLRYNKTERGQVNVYYLPGRRQHHALIDTAGEDYRVLGDYTRELPELMSKFLWPVLQRLDGLMLLMALPIVWAGWNQEGEERRVPSSREKEEMREAQAKMLAAHRMLVKYAVVARNLRRLRRQLPELKLTPELAPTRDQVDDAFLRAPLYDRPVSVVLSKADLYVGRERPCLFTPPLPRLSHTTPLGIKPDVSDPLLVAAGHFPDFLEFLCENVRSFKWTFAQALEDRSDAPSPMEARQGETDVSSLVGAEGAVDFLTRHPWRIPGPSTARMLQWDRRLRPQAWEAVAAGGGRV